MLFASQYAQASGQFLAYSITELVSSSVGGHNYVGDEHGGGFNLGKYKINVVAPPSGVLYISELWRETRAVYRRKHIVTRRAVSHDDANG